MKCEIRVTDRLERMAFELSSTRYEFDRSKNFDIVGESVLPILSGGEWEAKLLAGELAKPKVKAAEKIVKKNKRVINDSSDDDDYDGDDDKMTDGVNNNNSNSNIGVKQKVFEKSCENDENIESGKLDSIKIGLNMPVAKEEKTKVEVANREENKMGEEDSMMDTTTGENIERTTRSVATISE